jgi:hypothetical protein
MRLLRTSAFFLLVLLAGAITGCARDSLAELPLHELNLSNRALCPRPNVAPSAGSPQMPTWGAEGSRQWRYIVIHHSATEGGNAEVFDKLHRSPSFGFDELGYHFVITNGNGGPDGAIEVGSRWHKQKWGAHCGGTPGNEYNNHGIGICLVGDFSANMPTAAQMDSLRKLVFSLMAARNMAPENVIGHREAPNAATECPGRALSAYIVGTFRGELSRQLIAARTVRD